MIQQEQGDLTAALKTYGQARDAYSAASDKIGVSSALNNLATIYESQGKLARAEVLFRKSLDFRQEMANESDVAESLYNLAGLLTLRGNVVEAQKDFFGLFGGGQKDVGLNGSGRPVTQLAVLPGLTHYSISSSSALATAVTPFLDAPMPASK